MDSKLFYHFAEKYLDGTATPEEKELVEHWYAELAAEPFDINAHEKAGLKQELIAELEKAIEVPATYIIPLHRRKWFRSAAAAIIILALGGATWFMFRDAKIETTIASTSNRYTGSDVLPGTYKAKLTLDNGKTIILDSVALGELAQQGSAKVINKDGQLMYESSQVSPIGGDLEGAQPAIYNTLATAKGETYSMTLADGSIITLNAGSSVRFPVAFPGKERRIELTGEVYIKVAKDKTKPFIASVNGMDVLALGTEFNINAYNDNDKVLTTLVEGSVKVSKSNEQIILQAGQQAIYSGNSITKSSSVDMEKTLAWKNNEFIFDQDELPVIMQQLERWYDVKVVYEGVIQKRTFSGSISRLRNASAVLNMLKSTGVIKMKIEGNKIIVTP